MALTLRTMLEMEVLAIGRPRVVSGEGAIDRPVRWVHVAEVDDIADLLGGHEVVLTTGLPFTGERSAPEQFVSHLAAANSCGLIVELSPRLPALPPALVEKARLLDLPVVTLREPVRFVSITESVHRLIVGEQYEGLEFAQRTHEVFTNLSLDSADPMAVVRAGATLIESPLVLEDAGHRVVAFAEYDRSSRELLNKWEERSRDTPTLEDPGPAGPAGWLTCPVGLRGAVWGRLIAPVPTTDPARSSMVLQRAAQALQMSRFVERDATRLQFQAQESLLQELMNRKLIDEADALARARALGMKGANAYLPVVALFESSGLSDQIDQQRRARLHLEIISDVLGGSRVSAIAGGIADGRVGMIVTLDRATNEEAVLDRLATGFLTKSKTKSPVIGVGRAAKTLLTAALHLQNASHIADAASAIPNTTARWFRSTDVRLRGFIAQLQDDERLLGFMESELGALLAHDARYGTDLVDVLRAYVSLRGNKAALAAATHISRQALYGRLRKLESILHVDLDSADSMLSLGVAVLAYDTRRAAPDLVSRFEIVNP